MPLIYALPAIGLGLLVSACSSPRSISEVTMNENCSADEDSAERIESGESVAVAQAILSLECLDGGLLEDKYRSLGVAFTKRPSTVAEQIQRTRVSTELLLPMFIMLPLSFVDDPCASEQELVRRATIVRDSTLDSKKKFAFLKVINESIAREHEHCKVD